VLEEIEWLQDEMDTHFISWVDDVYGWPNKARNFKSILSELKSTHTLDWNARTITSSSIALEYKKLADKIRSHFVTMNGRVVSADNTVYFKRPDLYIEHKKKL
jgi:3-deoxy-D-arabino-heptulosonate 7-phosphate (DAHP) synthase class II